MSVGIYTKEDGYVKCAGNAKDSTATNTIYNNSQSGIQSSNVQGAIDEIASDINSLNSDIDSLNSTVDDVNSKISTIDNRDPSSTNIIIFPDVPDLRIKCSAGYVSGAIYGFMQNVGAFAINIYGNGGNIGISDLQGNVVSLGLISVNRHAQDVGNELSINSSNYFKGIFIGVSI